MTTAPRFPEAALDAAADVVRRLTGLVFPPVRRGALSEGLARAMGRAEVRDLPTYLGLLATDRDLLEDLASDITVGESYFFRAPEQVALVVELVREASGRFRPGPLRVWSAGCAAGEEPYSISIALHRAGLAGAARILATDLSPRALERARRGRYSRWSLRGVDPDIERSCFRPVGDELELDPDIRRTVELRCLNLAEDVYPSLAGGVWGMDVIVCRNVLIYFDACTAARVMRRLVDSLSPDGWLVLGGSDPTIVEQVACEAVVTNAGLAYRRAKRSPRTVPISTAPVEAAPEPASRFTDPPVGAPAAPSAPESNRPQRATPAQDPAASLARVEDLSEKASQSYADGAYDRAAALAREAVSHGANAGPVWVVLVRALANQGLLEDAGRACATALDRHRTCAELHYLHAVLLSEAGRHAAAAAAARRALYVDPTLVVAHLALATALARSGGTAGARQSASNARRLLEAVPPGAPVPAADGESAARLLQMAAVQLRLLSEAAA